METKKILVLLGNEDKETYTGSLADLYEQSAREAGHEVKRFNIGDMQFDPILHKGYKVIQELEPDLLALQEAWKWADHTLIVYPNWWNTMPAILKGLFDRFWLPGFAFNFEKPSGKLIQHLKGKTARVIIVAGTHSPFQTWWKYGDYTNEIKEGILEFAGIKTKVTAFGPHHFMDEKAHAKWEDKVRKFGTKGI
ncbi:NAD(P)H-dependent oxidoreductase [Candidatus Kaiserbacteria bacterium]|nr:NAD(P)H-dependent oxidoreductase [Candidatus Kaiserbacteria bacterium]